MVNVMFAVRTALLAGGGGGYTIWYHWYHWSDTSVESMMDTESAVVLASVAMAVRRVSYEVAITLEILHTEGARLYDWKHGEAVTTDWIDPCPAARSCDPTIAMTFGQSWGRKQTELLDVLVKHEAWEAKACARTLSQLRVVEPVTAGRRELCKQSKTLRTHWRP